MKSDWSELLFGGEDAGFLPEVLLRSLVMFVVVLLALLLLGKRGVKQLSVFELVIILTLGSAAGDPMFYHDVGLVVGMAVFATVVLLYRVTIFIINKSDHVQRLVKGKPVYLIKEGKFIREHFENETITFEEFFEELRQCSVSQLGQVETAILETSGNISLFFYPDDEVQAGLPILPHLFDVRSAQVAGGDFFACCCCARVAELDAGAPECSECAAHEWVPASRMKRIP